MSFTKEEKRKYNCLIKRAKKIDRMAEKLAKDTSKELKRQMKKS